jgi:hypothetical protein
MRYPVGTAAEPGQARQPEPTTKATTKKKMTALVSGVCRLCPSLPLRRKNRSKWLSAFYGQSISGGRILRAVIQDVKRKKSQAGRILHSISRPASVFDLTTLRYAIAITAPKWRRSIQGISLVGVCRMS